MARSASLQTTLQRYLGVTAAQLATSAACLRQHAPSARLARWVLMSQDRAQAERFAVTPAFLTYMLGQGPRGVAQATRALQHRGLIDLQGDVLQVMDRPGLEAAAFIRQWLTLDLAHRVAGVGQFRKTILKADGTPRKMDGAAKIEPDLPEWQEDIAEALTLYEDRRSLLACAEIVTSALEIGRAFAVRWEARKARALALVGYEDEDD